ncbi:hypothetical protein ACRTEV_21430 [Rossellomorea arthrocnemi]
MSVRFQFDYREVDALLEKFKRLPDNVEKTINSVLHSFGVKEVVKHITQDMPMSRGDKRHAKLSDWSKSENGNLEFTIKAKGGAANKPGSFGYLVFPNEGRGPSNPLEQRFMESGLYKSTSPVLEEINKEVDKRIREELE